MATNLRLSPGTAGALQDAARATGRSQQELIREAVETFLGIGGASSERQRLLAAGIVRAGTSFQDVEPWIALPPGMTILGLLDRGDYRGDER